MLSDRARTVLNILVDQHVHTAAPVSSEEIARLSATKVSPATVRSAMSQLTNEGYISRPHVSAGGVPLDLGYRCYVESLRELPQLPFALRRKIDLRLNQTEPDLQVWSQQCASILAAITANLAIVTVPQASAPRLRHIELVYLQEFLALLIIVLQESRLLRRLLPMDEGVDQDSLDRAAEKLNVHLGGLTRSEIEGNRLELTPLEGRVMHDSMVMLREAETTSSQEHYVHGLRLLLSQPEFSEGGRVNDLVEMLEERVLVKNVLSMTARDKDVGIYIGEENSPETLHHFGVIVCGYGIPDQLGGTICVIGPTRMGYAQAISGVRYLSSFMDQLLSGLHGGNPAG